MMLEAYLQAPALQVTPVLSEIQPVPAAVTRISIQDHAAWQGITLEALSHAEEIELADLAHEAPAWSDMTATRCPELHNKREIAGRPDPSGATGYPGWACGAAVGEPLLVEEIELQPVSDAVLAALPHEAVFSSALHSEKVWPDLRHATTHPVSAPQPPHVSQVQALPVPQDTLPGHGESQGLADLLLVTENDVTYEEMALFMDRMDKPLRFASADSCAGAHRESDERAWIQEVLDETMESCARATSDGPQTHTPDWALHLDEFEVMEHIELQPVDMVTRVQVLAG